MFFTKVGLFGVIICVHYPLNSQDKGPTAGADCTQREGTLYWLAGCSCHCFPLSFPFPFFFCIKYLPIMVNTEQLAWFQKKKSCAFEWSVSVGCATQSGGHVCSLAMYFNRTEDWGQEREVGGEMTHCLEWKREHWIGAWCRQKRANQLKKEVPGDLQEGNMASVVGIQISVSKYICDGTKVGGVRAWEGVIRRNEQCTDGNILTFPYSFRNSNVVRQTGRYQGHKNCTKT